MFPQDIDSFDIIMVSAAAGLVGFFVYGLYKVIKPIKTRKRKAQNEATVNPNVVKFVVTSSDISAIAGDDVMATQLDLARAYVETGRYALAKKILDHVREHGNHVQQQEADHLLNTI